MAADKINNITAMILPLNNVCLNHAIAGTTPRFFFVIFSQLLMRMHNRLEILRTQKNLEAFGSYIINHKTNVALIKTI